MKEGGEELMQYKIECKGVVIASFLYPKDAEKFLTWKRERMLLERNKEILDQIASEKGLDRKYPGLFPMSITEPYYIRERAQIAEECFLKVDRESDLMRMAKEWYPNHDYYEALGEHNGGSYVVVTSKDKKRVYEVYYSGTEITSRCMDEEE